MYIFYSPQFTTGASTAFNCLLIMDLSGCISTGLDLRKEKSFCNLQMCLLFLWSSHSCFTAKMVSWCCSRLKIAVTRHLAQLMNRIPLVMMCNIYMSNFINVICPIGTHTRFRLDLRSTVAPHSVTLGQCQSLSPALLYWLGTCIFQTDSEVAIWNPHSI